MKPRTVIALTAFAAVCVLVFIITSHKPSDAPDESQPADVVLSRPENVPPETFANETPQPAPQVLASEQSVSTPPPTAIVPDVELVIAKDVADGINAEVRAKEARLRAFAANLRTGLVAQEVIELMGNPDTAKKRIVDGWEIRFEEVSLTNGLDGLSDVRLGYWPRVGVPFNGKNGQGYQVLYIWIDSDGRLASLNWQSPAAIITGGLRKTLSEQNYWTGNFTLSGPPPSEYWQYTTQ